ncbi:hypothetical protein B5F77_04970 [Parabacteroides sp. An277]|uniref:InlB B-repeat-containing protein n=1 Tax=Parabacteroides sp. An277 TaxID=1965619 RepID=UPI000B36EB59|nr:InlB B-repeat-containing protein [Parabacteroides sp. An277]OUO53686.1 hypothetical protein B5F77_04970 [Parabacteroides sp. An277]
MNTRIFTLLVAFLATLSGAVWGQETTTAFSGGSGTDADPYQISTEEDLKTLATSVNDEKNDYKGKYFILTQSITLNENEEWTPIGGNPLYGGTAFKGIFDGKGYTISGLCIKEATFTGDGLFGWIGNSTTESFSETAGIVKNLTVEGEVEMTISTLAITGGICGYNYGTIQNCVSDISFDITYTQTVTVGGICGTNGGIIQNCVNKGDISLACQADAGYPACMVGGICGVSVGTIEKCYNEGDISGNNQNTDIGGICGSLQETLDEPPHINNCYNVGTLTLNSETGGDIAGICVVQGPENDSSKECFITNCHNYGAINSNASSIGGIFCGSEDVFYIKVNVENCYYINTITPDGTGEDVEGVEPKSAEDFANGGVLALLQKDNPGVWKQGDEYPIFLGKEEEETTIYQVTFNYNYEGSPEAITKNVAEGKSVTVPELTREGYTFTNWSTDEAGENMADISGTITPIASITYYAQWQAEQTEDPDDDNDNTGDDIHHPQRSIKYYNIYVDTICPGLEVETSKDVVQEGHQVSAYLTIQAECDTTGMRFEYKRGLFGYWQDLKELEGVQPGEYIIKNIYTDIYIRALDATLPEEEPTGLDDLEGIRAYAKEGSIYVYTPNREEVMIISMSSAILKREEQIGWQSYDVNRGIYIVRVGEKVFKLKN